MKQCIAILLSVTMLISLAACGKTSNGDPKEGAAAVASGTLKEDSTVIAVGQTKVTYGEFQAYSYMLEHKYESVLTNKVWNYSLGAKKTLGTEAIEDIARLIIQIKVINRKASDVKVSLNAEEKEDVAYKAEKYVASVPVEERKQYSINTTMITKILEDNQLARKVYDVVTAKANVNLTPQETEAVKVQMIQLVFKGTNREGTKVDMDEAAITQLYDEATTLLEKAKKASSFYTLAQEKSDVSEIEYNIGHEFQPKELADAVFSLKQGEFTGVIKGTDRYYMALVIQTNNEKIQEEHKESVIVERQTKAFKDQYKRWAECFGVKISKELVKY